MHVEPDLLPEEASVRTDHRHDSSSSAVTTESQPRSSSPTLAERTGACPELPGGSGCLSNSDHEAGPGTSEDTFSTLLYWRTPLPDISKEVEVLLSGTGPLEESHCGPEATCDSCVARSEIQKVLQSLQGHLLQDPDIQGRQDICVLWMAQDCFLPPHPPRALCCNVCRYNLLTILTQGHA